MKVIVGKIKENWSAFDGAIWYTIKSNKSGKEMSLNSIMNSASDALIIVSSPEDKIKFSDVLVYKVREDEFGGGLLFVTDARYVYSEKYEFFATLDEFLNILLRELAEKGYADYSYID